MRLYKKMVNLLVSGEKRISDLYELIPEEKSVSLRATVNMRPDLFIRVARGVIGRKNRDEWLIEKYRIAKESTKIIKPKRKMIWEYLEELLSYGNITLEELCLRIPFPRKSITSKLTLNPKFERVEKGVWHLKGADFPSLGYEEL